MKANYYNSNVHVQNGEHGIQPGVFIVENNTVYLLTITPNHRFDITNEGKLGEKYRYNTAGSIEWCGDKLPGGEAAIYSSNNIIDLSDKKEETPKFTWGDHEDPELYKNGVTILWVVGGTKSIQAFVEKLSEKIGSKCDFSWTAGRAHIDCFPEAKDKAIEAINDKEFMDQFIVPYTSESFDNESYFEILH